MIGSESEARLATGKVMSVAEAAEVALEALRGGTDIPMPVNRCRKALSCEATCFAK